MPTSNLAVWPDILLALQQVPHRRVLDVGPGHGKAAVLMREYLSPPPEVIDAVEAWEPYCGRFDLECLYDRLYIGDVTDVVWELDGHKVAAAASLATYDVVLMGDVIEHIELAAAMDLLRRIPCPVVICTPVDYFDNDPHGQHPPTEAHVSHWTQREWDSVGEFRSVDVCYQTIGGWIVRLGRLG
ncbi:MAG TPA: methyltransferase domain-containing protein [Pedococcus sp.]|nr:methyltransferase domain-containing protein [Pedococcus sp.]